jgi:hypothetical protein
MVTLESAGSVGHFSGWRDFSFIVGRRILLKEIPNNRHPSEGWDPAPR